jgi:hypothetical protein
MKKIVARNKEHLLKLIQKEIELNGNGGVTMTLMPTEISFCDAGFKGDKVKNNLCGI